MNEKDGIIQSKISATTVSLELIIIAPVPYMHVTQIYDISMDKSSPEKIQANVLRLLLIFPPNAGSREDA
jgi:hypothetical protein